MNNTWDKSVVRHLMMPFMPSDGYVSYQNPPDFTWTGIEGAESYDLVVCADRELTDVRFSRSGLEYNFHNFDCAFDVGRDYFWAVRCYKDGCVTEWSEPRSFRIHPDACEFTVPHVSEILSRIKDKHPRICTTADELSDFRALKDKNADARAIFDTYVKKARAYTEEGVVDEEPIFVPDPDWVINAHLKMVLLGKVNAILEKAFTCGFAYLLTGDRSLADFGIKMLLSISAWDINGATSYKIQDQVHRAVAYRCAMAYDWLADAMTEEQKRPILDMIRARTKVMEYLLPRLKSSPYDSHGWTAFGYIGIIAIATYGEIPEARGWLEQIIPQYTVILPPWSYQDGGWSQGTDYWQYSTASNKEFIDVLRTGGILDLYKKAWQRSEHLWSMYVYPYGLHGSFGDQANRRRSGFDSKNSLYRDACYTGSGVARWLAERHGELSRVYYNYNVSRVADIPSVAPDGYPLSHHFRDIGWAVLSNDITTPERIMLTFKSSRYGSFNHSHADQNSFIIQAFGENLAIKSGYYDAYHSKHDSGFTRKSHAHNTVTLSASRGQQDDSMDACGEITAFLTQSDIDLVSGDATPAYCGIMDRFKRHIVYVRPNAFIAVDDLKTPAPERFEWWLNAEHDIEITDNGRGAVLREGDAVLDASVVYPERVKAEVFDKFCGSDGAVYPAEGAYTDANIQRRVRFETEALSSTKMIVTMGTHRSGDEGVSVISEQRDGYVKLTVGDDTAVYIGLGDPDERVITDDGVEFVGAIAVIGKRSAMLADGVILKKDGKLILSTESHASVAVGCGELAVSTRTDNTVTLGLDCGFADGACAVTDKKGRASAAIGIDNVSADGAELKVKLRADEYSLLLK